MKLTGVLFLTVAAALAQVPNPTQQQHALTPAETGQAMPVFRVTVVSRTTKAINYHHRNGSTRIDFRGTELMPTARGEAKVESQMGSTKIETSLDHMTPAGQYGPEYMTYVLWGVTPEGRAVNLGEVVLDGDHAKLLSTTDLQTFGLIVTAEPYFAVTQPSDVVVAENFVRNETTGTIEQVDAKYELLQRGQYVFNRSAYKPIRIDHKGPLQLAEAENAVEIARLAGADRYAADTFEKAKIDLQNAQDYLNKSKNRKMSETNAREAAQMAEDARIITWRKIREEQLAAERAAAAKREADAKAQADAEAARARQAAEDAQRAAERARMEQEQRLRAESDRQAADQARLAAEQAKRDAEQAAAQASQEKAAADAAKAAALAQQQSAQAEAERARQAALQADQARQQAEAQRLQAENEKTALRERLRQQLNLILETRETARGLIVNISDVLFDFNKYTLKPGAREKMAKVAGILLAYPGLKIQLEGHTDSIGTDEYNMKLSEQRATTVRDYLVSQGVPMSNLAAVGLGKSSPVASNDTAAGRQQNRRVEMIVSGEPIGIDSTLTGSIPR
ncbi:MAG TPA: OmpA family protein [Bryobacteraceae bacterium]|jgi:outer membrane protein OmpA-like peptidoglycan-associated protein